MQADGIDLHIATGRVKHGETIATGSEPPLSQHAQTIMQHKLRTEAGHAVYKMRKPSSNRSSARSRSNEAPPFTCADWRSACRMKLSAQPPTCSSSSAPDDAANAEMRRRSLFGFPALTQHANLATKSRR